MTKYNAKRMPEMDDWFRYHQPYTFVKLETSKCNHVYLPLNRDYKPLGITSYSNMVNYEDFINQAVIFSADPHTIENVWINEGALFLYRDDPSSRLDYYERLERLERHSVKWSET